MRTRTFGTLAGLVSGAFTAATVIIFIADNMLPTANNNIAWWWDGVTGKRRKLTEDEMREIQAQAAAEFEAAKDVPPRPGIRHPAVSWHD